MEQILIACEESQTVTKAFRALGHKAFSCDILPCSGGHPEWHLQQDVGPLLREKNRWALIIAFPPCTHIANSGARWFEEKRRDGRQAAGINFFMQFANIPDSVCKRVAIENPVGIMSRHWRKPDQIVQPYYFGDPFKKTTCLWLKNLPLLGKTNVVGPGKQQKLKSGKSLPEWYSNANKKERARIRSKTFEGIASAMASQWGSLY